jgi:hypothetical protein
VDQLGVRRDLRAVVAHQELELARLGTSSSSSWSWGNSCSSAASGMARGAPAAGIAIASSMLGVPRAPGARRPRADRGAEDRAWIPAPGGRLASFERHTVAKLR